MRGESVGVTERKEQDMAKDQDKKGIPKVQIDMFNWGPCVVRMRINEDFQNKLLSEAKNNKEDYVWLSFDRFYSVSLFLLQRTSVVLRPSFLRVG